MLHQYEFFCESSIRGYRAYFKEITICIGDILFREIEKDNEEDEHAVVVKSQDGGIAGHVPVDLSDIFHKFLEDYGEILLECIGFRYNRGEGKGLELPVDYQFVGNLPYLKIVRTSLKSKGLKLDITKIRPSDAPIALVTFA